MITRNLKSILAESLPYSGMKFKPKHDCSAAMNECMLLAAVLSEEQFYAYHAEFIGHDCVQN